MKRDELSVLIRELLLEELAALRQEASPPTERSVFEETVSIETDGDLNRFARRMLDLARDSKARNEIETGRYRFRLSRGEAPISEASSVHELSQGFDKGLITEKEIIALPDGLSSIRAGKAVRFTPLASDILRQRGIKIERTKQ